MQFMPWYFVIPAEGADSIAVDCLAVLLSAWGVVAAVDVAV